MFKLKTKWFNKWAKKNSLSDSTLLDTIDNLIKNLNAVKIGAGLYKVRTVKSGKGKSGGYRTIVVFRNLDLAIFIYGFSKSDKENLSKQELKYFKKLSNDLLSIDKIEFNKLLSSKDFIEIKE